MKPQKVTMILSLAFLALLLFSVPTRAGFFDDLSKAAGQVADQVKKTTKSVGNNLGITDAGNAKPAAKLPGGVSDRLKKIDKELDRAEQALAKGGGGPLDRSKRAESYLRRADGYKKEIEKAYSGKYDPKHPQVAACYDRLEKTRQNIAQASSEAAKAVAEANKAMPEKQLASAPAPAPAQTGQDYNSVCEKWAERLKQFTQGDKPLHAYPTEDKAQLLQWKEYYDQAEQTRDEMDSSGFDKTQCPQVAAAEKQLSNYMTRFEEIYAEYEAKQSEQKEQGILFSKSPIDPQNPSNLSENFRAGDYIYALVLHSKPWSSLFRNGGDLRINVAIDGSKPHAQFILLRKPEDLARKYALLEIAPDPASMLSYTGKLPDFGKTNANLMQGPMELCQYLGQLGPGRHTVHLEVASYDVRIPGSFTIEGDSYGFYADLGQKMASAASKTVVLPAAKMTNKALEDKMRKLLANAGWDNVYRLNIKDPDWWIERMSGGNSPVKARYLNVAAMCQDSEGYCYRICVFHQDRTLSGWSDLYLSRQGDKVRVTAENKDK